MSERLPARTFISHAYADAPQVERLVQQLSGRTETVIFPRREPDPARPVSDAIIPTLLNCDGLIHLTKGASAHSFWVSFERDYALRAGRRVFAHDPVTSAISPDLGAPVDLDVEVYFNRRDGDAVDALFDWMAKERHFKISRAIGRGLVGGIKGDDVAGLTETLYWGGPVLWMLSPGSAVLADAFHNRRSGLLDAFYAEFQDEPFDDYIGRRFPELVDDPPSPREIDPHQFVENVFARISADYPADGPFASEPRYVDLLADAPPGGFNWNRVDDLIINLYAAVMAARD